VITLVQIPTRSDNYAYLCVKDGAAFVVDASDAEPVLDEIRARDVRLAAVLNTHHHGDHVGGNLELKEATGCEIIAPAHDAGRHPGMTRGAVPGESVEVAGMQLRVLDVRGHTDTHIAYALDEKVDEVVRHGHEGSATSVERLAGRPALFVGDTLFMGGCGRLFEGTPEEMTRAIALLKAEPAEALVVCAHEYTASNLRFAADALPGFEAVERRMAELDEERGASGSSVPDTLARELETNPFLLCLDDEWRPRLAERYGVPADDPAVVFAAVRGAKDIF
jgi:hydroxyacylglutathione hydrolase